VHAIATPLISKLLLGRTASTLSRGKIATMHWAALDFLHYCGAVPAKSRVFVAGNFTDVVNEGKEIL
jgi:hypothetical protein